MRRREREIIEIGECAPLDAVIERLQSLHVSLADDAQPIVTVDGSDYFGWRLTVTYYREATLEERELEARYASPSLGNELKPSSFGEARSYEKHV